MRDIALLVLTAGIGERYRGLKQIDPVGPSGETILLPDNVDPPALAVVV
jgi:hypothetical protein